MYCCCQFSNSSFGFVAFMRACSTVAEAPKPFSAIPPYSQKGVLPYLGHSLRIRKGLNVEVKKMFEEVNSPILRLLIPGPKRIVFYNDPEIAKLVCSLEGKYPEKGIERDVGLFYKFRNEKPHFTFGYGPEWREDRNMYGKLLSPANVYGYVPGFNRITNRMIQNIEETQDSSGYVDDIQKLITHWSLEVAAWFSFGVDLDTMKDSGDAHVMQKAVQSFLSLVVKMSYMAPIYKAFPMLMRKTSKQHSDLYQIVENYTQQHVDCTMESSASTEETRYGQSLLEQWLIEGKQTKEEAIQNSSSMMAAGFDMTSNVLSFMLYELSKHKGIQDKLHNQVFSVLGKDGEPDINSLQKMPYLMNIIKESQRVRPAFATFSRQLPKDAVILGYSIPAGTSMLYSLLHSSTNENIFKEPYKFNPDRWSTDDISPYASIPFGVGPRSCWGRRFAEVEMKVFLAKMSQYFIMECDNPVDSEIPFKEDGVLRPANPLKIKFLKRT